MMFLRESFYYKMLNLIYGGMWRIALRFRICRKCFDNHRSDEVSCLIKFLKKLYLTMIASNDYG